MLTLTFFGAFRRSEVVSLNIENIEFTDNGMAIPLLRSKTIYTKQTVYISFAKDKGICPVNSLKKWIEQSEDVTSSVSEFKDYFLSLSFL